MQAITLRGMRFHGLVGILPHERVSPQPIEVDLHVRLGEARTDATDAADVADTDVVDYRALYAIVAGVVSTGPIDYLEQVGERIARATLRHSARVRAARVAVRKPHVALGGPLDYAEVVTELTADD